MNEVVKYHNDLARVSFVGFTATDLNVLMGIFVELKEVGTKRKRISADRLKELADYKSKDNKRFIKYLKELAVKCHGLYYMANKEKGGFVSFTLFEEFETIDEVTEFDALDVEISNKFAYILNSDAEPPEGILPLLMGYTTFFLAEHNGLKSTYSKIAFMHLKRFKRTGWWRISVDDFRQLMGIPESYRMSDIRRRVLSPIQDELPAYFNNLKITEIKAKTETGRKGTVSLQFDFDKQLESGVWHEDDTKAALEDRYKCPVCGEPLWLIIKKDGDTFYGHRDGWKQTAKCRQTFGSLNEILGNNEDEAPPEASDKRANKKKPEKAGFSCRECGRPLYILHNKKGEMFYGHLDGYKEGAPCKRTYSSIAEIKGYSETPTRADHSKYEEERDKVSDIDKEKKLQRIDEIVEGINARMEEKK